MNAWKAQFSSAHFDTSFITLRCCFDCVMGIRVGRRSNLKSCKSSYSNQKDTRLALQKRKLKLNGELCNFWKSTLSHSMTHNSANQHRIATGEVSKCAEENRLFMNSFSVHKKFQFLIYLTIYIVYGYFLCAVYNYTRKRDTKSN